MRDFPTCFVRDAHPRLGTIHPENIPQPRVVFTALDERAEDATQGKRRYTRPLSQIRPQPTLIHQSFTDIEDDAPDLPQTVHTHELEADTAVEWHVNISPS